VRSLYCLLPVAFFVATMQAQQPQPPSDNSHDDQPGQVIMHDGGVSQTLQSIYIPPIQGAPFSATVHTEWIKYLPDGGTITLVNQRQVARDSLGRIYEERWLLVPKGGKAQSQMNLIQIGDPVAHTMYSCFTMMKPHQCMLQTYAGSSSATYRPPTGQNGPLPNGNGFRTHEDLGMQNISGVETVGTRDTTTYNQGVIGNDIPVTAKREFWFAPSLAVNLRSEVTGPNFGKEIFSLSDVNLSEPDPKLFQVPDGFEVVDQRKPAPRTE
jgi:hypothetical protein